MTNRSNSCAAHLSSVRDINSICNVWPKQEQRRNSAADDDVITNYAAAPVTVFRLCELTQRGLGWRCKTAIGGITSIFLNWDYCGPKKETFNDTSHWARWVSSVIRWGQSFQKTSEQTRDRSNCLGCDPLFGVLMRQIVQMILDNNVSDYRRACMARPKYHRLRTLDI